MANQIAITTGFVLPNVDPNDIATAASMFVRRQSASYLQFASQALVTEFPADPKKGTTINVKVLNPDVARDLIADGSAVTSDMNEQLVPVVIQEQIYVQKTLSATEMMYEAGPFLETIVKPAAEGIANRMNTLSMEAAREIPYFSGSPGTAFDSMALLAPHVKGLDDRGAAQQGRFGLLGSGAYTDLAFSGQFSDVDRAGTNETRRTGTFGVIGEFDVQKDLSVEKHTAGTFGNGTIDGVVAAGETSLDIDVGTGDATGTIKNGDLFTVASVPGTFVFIPPVATPLVATANAITNAPFTPAAPVGGFPDGNVVTIVTSHTKNLFGSNGVILAAAVASPRVQENQGTFQDPRGFSMRWTIHPVSSVNLSTTITFDVWFGVKLVRPVFGNILVTAV